MKVALKRAKRGNYKASEASLENCFKSFKIGRRGIDGVTNNWIILIHSSSMMKIRLGRILLSKSNLKIDFRSHKRVNGRSERFKVSKSIYSPSATTLDFIAKPLTPTCQAQIDPKENENDGLPSSALRWKRHPVPTLCSQGRTSSQLHKTIKWPNFWHVRDNWKI